MIKITIVSFLLLIVFPVITSAQSVSIKSEDLKHNLGDTFLVNVTLNSMGKSINTLGGKIIIPKNFMEVKGIQTGGSFVSLWTEKPTLNEDGSEIIFSGGLPGGYSGSDGIIFSFIVKTIKEGNSVIVVDDFNAFLNDGKGTQLSVKLISLSSTVKNDPSKPKEIYNYNEDLVSPERFEISIDRDSSIDNNQYFVSFFAVDKGLGVDRYEVEELPWIISMFGYKKVWESSQNPQVLEYQKWISTVKVRAYDASGNFTEEKIIKPMSFSYAVYLILATLIIITIVVRKKINIVSKKINGGIIK